MRCDFENISPIRRAIRTFRDEPGKTMEDFLARPEEQKGAPAADTKKAGRS